LRSMGRSESASVPPLSSAAFRSAAMRASSFSVRCCSTTDSMRRRTLRTSSKGLGM